MSEFKKGSGIDLHSRWDDHKKIGEAVKFIQSGGIDAIRKQLFGLEETAKIVLNRISEGLQITAQQQATDSTCNGENL